MRTVTMMELKKMCRKISPAIFVFDSNNQFKMVGNLARTITRYYDVIFMLSPDRICFKNDTGILCLTGIKRIQCDDFDGISYVFQIVCGNQSDDSKDVAYTILADKNFSK